MFCDGKHKQGRITKIVSEWIPRLFTKLRRIRIDTEILNIDKLFLITDFQITIKRF